MDGPGPTIDIVPMAVSALGFALELPAGFDQVIGRDPSAEITIGDGAISRRHARLFHDGEGVWIEDLGSSNGTFVNGSRVVGRCRLRDRDEVVMGSSTATYHDVASGPMPTELLPATPVATSPPSVGAPQPDRPTGGAPRAGSTVAAGCPNCGRATASELWFCAHCGRAQRPLPRPSAPVGSATADLAVDRVISPHGRPRRAEFRQAMRAGNGGRRPRYNEGLAASTIMFRLLLVVILVGAAATLVVLAKGRTHNAGPARPGRPALIATVTGAPVDEVVIHAGM